MWLLSAWWKVLIKLATIHKSFIFLYHHRIATAC
jgi:hypothetical protein